jgi:hypothetical protein
MGIVIVMAVSVVCAGWIVWRRRLRRHASTPAVPTQGMTSAGMAHQAFVHGNTCLREGKFAEATTAFHQARELKPQHPHVAGRLAEVERQQQAASAMAPVKSPC